MPANGLLNLRKRAAKAGALALARRKASGWMMEAPSAPTSAQESLARAVVDAAFQECRVDELHRCLVAVVESAVPLKGQNWQWIHVDVAKLEEARLLLGVMSDKVAE